MVGDLHVTERGIYNDLLRTFSKNGHDVLFVSPTERRNKKTTNAYQYERITHLRVKSFNIQKTNRIEKGVATLLIEYLFIYAILRYFKGRTFDLIIYSTPPVTFTSAIRFFKWRNRAKTYLLLKDIFPQNAVDMKLIRENSLMHKYFSYREKLLYSISDYIGCMSPENVTYLLKHNPEINPRILEVNPNSLIPIDIKLVRRDRISIRKQYNIPSEKILFVYGGNLGIPQGIDYLIQVISRLQDITGLYFLVVGNGTEYYKLQNWFRMNRPVNAQLLPSLGKKDYDALLASADVGMVFLDKKFTIPNFPSRVLSYMELALPVIMATDTNSDIGIVAQENNFGFWSEAGKLETFFKHANKLVASRRVRENMGSNGRSYLLKNYTSEISYEIIVSHFKSV